LTRIMVISSDGHVTARMPDYRPYLESRFHEEFDAFAKVYASEGSRNFERPALLSRLDLDVVDDWQRDFLDAGRTDGNSDPASRLKEMEREGLAAEVLFPDFGLPFELYSPFLATMTGLAPRSKEQIDAGNRAFNRWLADFCNCAPERFAGLAAINFDDVEAAVAEIRNAKELGLTGVVLPFFTQQTPLFDPKFESIWQTIEDLEMPLAAHPGTSGITMEAPNVQSLAHPAVGNPIWAPAVVWSVREILRQMIWSGILERHPKLNLVLTEVGSGWVVYELAQMDHTYERSFLRRDALEVLPNRPSEYFQRQCYMGASLFSAAEINARHEIGLGNLLIGIDYPHHEGAWQFGTQDVLHATFGAAAVPEADARRILGENALTVYGFDAAKLGVIADRIGPAVDEILSRPSPELVGRLERGDFHKPL
jgi:predicted TIM-barrel fold metal-dependent hydrolase